MIQWLLHIVIDAGILLLAAKMMSKVELKGFKSALIVALIIGVLSFLLSWLLTAVLNIATLGIFYFLGLGFIIRVIVNAIIIELADRLSKDFKTVGFLPSLWLAILLAVVGGIVDAILF
ncbi:phage holin family protein [Zunongwangia sp. F260]|uniref:Phage holin family protein n=1 Tax=Autumnicola lenta TaxID=3075593 RepID=A0ABU3CI20_9FLAO|nr:phage holin family protein [Zunongwangia sp. F260]MDT0646011.1 phage holin family protein [Zunongwangia sp. F260]